MKLDWQHVVVVVAGLALVGVVIVLGKGNVLLQVLAGCGGLTGVAALLKQSPLSGGDS